jgi:hypothetical protein
VPHDISPNADAEGGFIPTFVDIMRIAPCREVTDVGVEHTVKLIQHATSGHRTLCEKS